MTSHNRESFPPRDLRGTRATVVGMAREGSALARFLARHGADVTVTDAKAEADLSAEIEALAGLPLRLALGGHPAEVLESDVVYVSPGVPPQIPLLSEARRRGIAVSSATEVFLRRCPAPVVGITGSSGKTTTTTLVGAMLEASGFRTFVGGNIGRPLLDDLDVIEPEDRVVMELSSFQLEGLPVSPPVAAVLNLTPDHLDRHSSFDAYVEAKSAILRYQRPGDAAILNWDDDRVRRFAGLARGTTWWFSLHGRTPESGAYLRGDELLVALPAAPLVLCRTGDLKIRGRHNQANVLAAGLAALAAGANPEAAASAARGFAGVPNRLEEVGRLADVVFVNDSIATSPTRAVAALESFPRPIVLLAGGRHKNLPLDDWARAVRSRVRDLVVFGEAARLLADAAAGSAEESARPLTASPEAGAHAPADAPQALAAAPDREHASLRVHTVPDLERATRLAARIAPSGAVVLLSPACASFDAYRDYVERGRHFREIVARIIASGRRARPADGGSPGASDLSDPGTKDPRSA